MMGSPDLITASDSDLEVENQSVSSSGSSLFKTQCVTSTPQRSPRKPVRKLAPSRRSPPVPDDSSDSSVEPRPLSIRAYYERLKKRKTRKRRRKYKPTGRPIGRPRGRRSRTLTISRKQIKDKESGLSVVEAEKTGKALPWRKILTFEQAVARGFFNYLEKLKYEYHLRESLKQMGAGEDLEKEDLDSRRYKCLDDDGSISPIEDVEEDAEEECDIKLVEEGQFIISSELAKKMDAQMEPDAVSRKRRRGQKGKRRGCKPGLGASVLEPALDVTAPPTC